MQQQPFCTQNRKLAEALALAGCKWASREEGGPTLNIYTAGFLRDRRLMSSHPVPIQGFEKAAKEAEARKIPGIVTYFFERDETFQRAEKAWQDCCIELARAKLASEPPNVPDIPPEVVAQVICIAAYSAEGFKNAPFVNPAWVTTMSGSRKEDPKSKAAYTIEGTGKAWPLNASKEVREKLGI